MTFISTLKDEVLVNPLPLKPGLGGRGMGNGRGGGPKVSIVDDQSFPTLFSRLRVFCYGLAN